ncbi:hypothetical protein B0T22DRAFT_474310 [Podospora appendiculata]|uniref:AAA+ ATPase domain-containing protein n=1 Tax=Podospora appendiculata TaxID=314037 RepID=A0AAE1C720_9PEZI|nr:hypothetical protein B0T22DRAFT_474310 [Podospora appendiculata]
MDGTLLIAAEVPAFCLTKKKWVKLPVDGLSPVQWDTNAFDKLILPPELVDFCTTVVSPRVSASKASSKEGLGPVSPPVVHLRGPTGTGKTATARAIAEQAQRPLYHLKFSELSDKFSDARSMLQAVEDILRAGAAWKAVLLIDKVDGALEHHRELDLEDLGEDIREMVDSVVDMLKAYPGIVMVETRPPNAAADDSSKKIEQQMKPLVKGTLTFPPLSAEARAAVYKRDIYRLMKAGGQLPSGMSWSEFQDTAEAQLPHPEAWGVLHRWPAAMDGHQILRLARTIFHVVTAPGWVADQEALALVLWTVTRRFRSGKDSDTNQEEKGWLWGTDKASELSKRMVKLLKTEKFFAADKREMLMEQAMGMWDDIERRWKDVELCPDEEESDVMALEFMVETAERLDNTEDWFVTLIEASLDKRQDCKLWAVDAARQVVRQLLDEHESAVAEMNEKHVAEIDTRFGEMARVVNGGMKWRNGTQMTPLDWFMVDATREELQREFQNANSLVRKHAEETQAEITRLKERIDELLWQVKEAIEEGEDDDEDEDEDEDEEGDDENE